MQDNTNHLFAILTHADATISRLNILSGKLYGVTLKCLKTPSGVFYGKVKYYLAGGYCNRTKALS